MNKKLLLVLWAASLIGTALLVRKQLDTEPPVVAQRDEPVPPIPPAPDTIIKFVERIKYVEKQPSRSEVKPLAKVEIVDEFCSAGGWIIDTDTVPVRGEQDRRFGGTELHPTYPTFITGGRLDGKRLSLYGVNAIGDAISASYEGVYEPFQFSQGRGSNFHVQSNRWGKTREVIEGLIPIATLGLGLWVGTKLPD